MRTIAVFAGVAVCVMLVVVLLAILTNDNVAEAPRDQANTFRTSPPNPPQPEVPPPIATETAERPIVNSAPLLGLSKVIGTVTDASTGAPVVGATLEIHESDPFGRGASTVSEDDGAFELQINLADARSISCVAPGYSRELKPIKADMARFDFALRPGAEIAGRVFVEETGAPVADVRVFAVHLQKNSFAETMADSMGVTQSLPDCRSGSDGTYRIVGVEPGTYRVGVAVRDAGYAFDVSDAAIVSIVETRTYEGIDVPVRQGMAIEGIVVDHEGTPVENAVIFAIPQSTDADPLSLVMEMQDFGIIRITSDKSGRFLLSGVDPTVTLHVEAEHPLYAGSIVTMSPIEMTGRRAPLRLVLYPGSYVSGKAKYADGRVAGNVQLELTPKEADVIPDWYDATTENDGSFTFDQVGFGAYEVRLAEQYDMKELASIQVDGVNPHPPLNLTIPNESETERWIRGTVTTATGRPVANVVVEATLDPMFDSPKSAATGPDGSFAISLSEDGYYELTARSEVGLGRLSGVEPGEKVALILHAPAHVSGVVVDKSGEPVASAKVVLEKANVRGELPDFLNFLPLPIGEDSGTASTNFVGHFDFADVLPGEYSVIARNSASATGASDTFEVSAGRDVVGIRVVLEPGVSIGGRVENAAGAPVSDAELRLVQAMDEYDSNEGEFIVYSEFSAAVTGIARSDAQGRFVFDAVSVGEHTLRAKHGDYADAVVGGVEAQAGRDVTDVRVVMQEGGRLLAKYSEDGKPKAGVEIMLTGDGAHFSGATDSNGEAIIANVPPGSYDCQYFDVSSALLTDDDEGLDFHSRPRMVAIRAGETSVVDFGEKIGVNVSGTVTGLVANSITMIMLHKGYADFSMSRSTPDAAELSEMMENFGGSATVSKNGRFVIREVPPGRYEVIVVSMPDRFEEMAGLDGSDFEHPPVVSSVEVGNEDIELNVDISGTTTAPLHGP